MARFTINADFDADLRKLQNIGLYIPNGCKEAVYDGAKVVADQIHKEILAIDINDGKGKSGITEAERNGLIAGLGVSKIKTEDGTTSAAIGFDGYNDYTTHAYPKGHANLLIARAINKGTSFRNPTKFISKAVNKSRAAAQKAMSDCIDKYIDRMSR